MGHPIHVLDSAHAQPVTISVGKLRSENVKKFEKIFKKGNVSDFIKEVEDIEVEDGDIAKEARTKSFQVEKYKMFVICFNCT